jgi:hypothetical protein
MTEGMIYVLVTVVSLSCVWSVWQFGFKPMFLDGFRQRLFELRLELFAFAEQGRISYDDEAYRAIEILLNGLIRYAHRMSFLTWVCTVRENARARRESKDIPDFGQQVALKIARLDPEMQIQISQLLSKVHSALALYLTANSLVFKLAAVWVLILRMCRPVETKEQFTQQVFVLEYEAYRSAKSRFAGSIV